MDIQITIQAPGLVKALEGLAAAIQHNNGAVFNVETAQALTPVQEFQQPVQQAPIQAMPASVPTQQPVNQPVQQTPIQQAPVQQQQPAQTVPTSAPSYTMDQLAVAATQLMDAGKRDELLQLLAAFGVQALTSLPQEQYGAFATKLRELGANI